MINKKSSNKKQSQPQPQTPAGGPTKAAPRKAKTIKLGVDVHLGLYVVVRVIDGGTPQPPQRFKPVEFLLWCAKQLTLAEKVFTCYEAGPFGYSLHRRLAKMGAGAGVSPHYLHFSISQQVGYVIPPGNKRVSS